MVLLISAISLIHAAGILTRITTASSQGSDPVNSRHSTFPSLSADGTRIAFASDSDFLGQGILTGQLQLWLYDTTVMTFTRITTISTNYDFKLSGNGQAIAFADATGIWLYNTVTMTFTHITGRGNLPQLNADGTKVAFISDADFLSQGIPSGQNEIWLFNTAAMTVTRITTASASNRDSGHSNLVGGLSLSSDGTKIAFISDSDFLGQGIPDEQYELWLYNTASMTVTRITTASDSSRDSHMPSLGFTGTKVAFVSNSDFLHQSLAENLEVWLYDSTMMTYTRVTTASASDRGSFHPSLSTDETKLTFMSDSDFLGQGIPRGQAEVWLYDIATKVLTPVTVAAGNGIRASEAPSINASGTRIAFHSTADFLGQGIPEFQREIWLYQKSAAEFYFPVIFKQSP
jgi:Tol biopolymer transport system component